MAKVLLFVAVILALFVDSLAAASSGRIKHREPKGILVETCSKKPRQTKQQAESVFQRLSSDEYAAVLAFMMAQPELGLIAADDENRKVTDNIIHFIEWDYPNKSSVLNYLDNGGQKPDRIAKVTVYRGSHLDIVSYRVGPLPQPTYYNQVYLKRDIHWNARNPDQFEYGLFDPVLYLFFKQINHISKDSFGGYTYSEDCELCLSYTDTAPRGMDNETRKTWLLMFFPFDGAFLHPIGLSVRIDHVDLDPTNWRVDNIFYNGYQFNNVDDFLEAYYTNRIKRIRMQASEFGSEESKWSSLYPRGEEIHEDSITPPEIIEREGHRWSLVGENTIKYLGWQFDFNIISTSGLHIFDARYKGNRVLYELGLKEALSTYSGYDPIQASSVYTDSSWGLGVSIYELIPGADCPANAEYFDYSYYRNGQVFVIKNSVCIFEQDLAYPARRHYNSDFSGTFTFASSQKGTALVVRTTAPVYNYDYIFDYIFYPNGVAEAKFALGGYLQTIHYSDNNDHESEYHASVRVHDKSMGSLHQHIAGYKVDIDVAGTENIFQMVNYETSTTQNPFFDTPVYGKKYVKNTLMNETGIQTVFNEPHSWVVTNPSATNKWGNTKGYKISTTASSYFVSGDDPRITGGSYGKYQVAVTKHKDSENHINSIYCQAVPTLCPQHLDDYLDNENINNTDLVLWISMGSFHLPIAEDVPSQETYGYTHSLIIRPYNFFDEDPSINLKGGVAFYRRDGEDGQLDTQIPLQKSFDCVKQKDLPQFDGNYL